MSANPYPLAGEVLGYWDGRQLIAPRCESETLPYITRQCREMAANQLLPAWVRLAAMEALDGDPIEFAHWLGWLAGTQRRAMAARRARFEAAKRANAGAEVKL